MKSKKRSSLLILDSRKKVHINHVRCIMEVEDNRLSRSVNQKSSFIRIIEDNHLIKARMRENSQYQIILPV